MPYSNSNLPYYIGCPVWSCHEWIGSVFPSHTTQKDLLKAYSGIFNTVEGNSLFYALPSMAIIERWMAETSDTFRFAMKFPKAISHERRLNKALDETSSFLRILEILQDGDRLGTSFLQLPPSFNINNLDTLDSYLSSLPKAFEYAVEPRHISFYDNGENEKRIDDILQKHGANKVIFDTRPLFSRDPSDADEEEAQSRKPQMPVRETVTANTLFLRFVGLNQMEANDPWIKEWGPIINKWILENKRPYVFIHTANDSQAPQLAKRLHQHLQKLNPLLPDFATLECEISPPEQTEEQLDLF